MTTIDTVVIGAGHAGLAASRVLTAAGREHVLLERGRVAERWRSERWDSLHLLTPNWMTRLPDHPYAGRDPDGFMSAAGFVRHLEDYAASFAAPVVAGAAVVDLSAASAGGYRVHTTSGTWHASQVVIATGPHGVPRVPGGLDADSVITSGRYRNPAQLPSGGVLVIGASSSGVQIADELNRAGRHVVLAVGRHTRMPRSYRGMDIFWWLERTGRLARTIDQVPDARAARREPSLQLIGRRPHRLNDGEEGNVDLMALQARGVRLVGRFDGISGTRVRLRADLADTTAAAERTMHGVLDAIDAHIGATGLADEVLPVRRPDRPRLPSPVTDLDLTAEGLDSVVVATGYRPHYPWLHLPITDRSGAIQQYRGVTPAPGVYVVGQRFQHRRDSGFVHGARFDAHAVVTHLTAGFPQETAAANAEEAAL
jgi:putative flavoprotein involved in K+ transport